MAHRAGGIARAATVDLLAFLLPAALDFCQARARDRHCLVGWLQFALHAWLGRWPALLLANLVYIFGPLHLGASQLGTPLAVDWATFGPVFAIGLQFGALYLRSGNLWLPVLPHGLWPLNMPA